MFQTKNFLSIVASMINAMRVRTKLITDFSVGSVARTMVEAPAQEIEELYQQMVAGLVEAVPVSVYRSFSFAPLASAAAGGLVRVSITPQIAAVVVATGTQFAQASSSVTYVATRDAVIPPGSSFVDVAVRASTAGAGTNLAAGTPFALSPPPNSLVGAVNLVAFIDGSDDETAAEQKTRFTRYVATLARGTVAALRFGAADQAFVTDAAGNVIERVRFVSIEEPYLADPLQPVGLVHLYLHNGTGATSAALVARVGEVIYGYYDSRGAAVPGYKAAGVRVTVAAATEVPVDVTAALTPALGYDGAALRAAAAGAIAAYVLGLDIGQSCILAEITTAVMEIPGVANFVTSGASDTLSSVSVKLMPGAIVLT